MWSGFKIVLSHFVALWTAVLALLASIATAYFRDQVSAGIRWILWPLTTRLPWNHAQRPRSSGQPVHELVSLFTVVQLRIFESDGSSATYEKTSDYEVRSATLAEYREGVTAEGTATNFTTLIGRITETIPHTRRWGRRSRSGRASKPNLRSCSPSWWEGNGPVGMSDLTILLFAHTDQYWGVPRVSR